MKIEKNAFFENNNYTQLDTENLKDYWLSRFIFFIKIIRYFQLYFNKIVASIKLLWFNCKECNKTKRFHSFIKDLKLSSFAENKNLKIKVLLTIWTSCGFNSFCDKNTD